MKLKYHSNWLHEEYEYPEWAQNIYYAIKRYLAYLARLRAWKPIIRAELEYDSHSIYSILEHKLQNLHLAMKNGHAIHEKEYMDAIKRCIKLCKVLHKDKYDDIEERAHSKKWGRLKTWTVKVEGSEDKPGGPYHQLRFSRPKAKTEAQKKQERKEVKQTWKNSAKARQADQDELFSLMAKYITYWWD